MTGGEMAARTAPPDSWVFNKKLMTPDRLVELGGGWPVRVQRDERGLIVVCVDCEGKVSDLAPSPRMGRRRAEQMTVEQLRTARLESQVWGPVWPIEPRQLLADVVRHRVMRHDLAVSGISAKE
jgi:hypothetical protein